MKKPYISTIKYIYAVPIIYMFVIVFRIFTRKAINEDLNVLVNMCLSLWSFVATLFILYLFYI